MQQINQLINIFGQEMTDLKIDTKVCLILI
ncbi:hypothetical protein NIES4102_14000 [Chondrocystis sp. NIES-4102]|nr:hypothetical protein NIES4102_14000 [Chondrocystis sp. NIES-4102]